MVDFVFYFMYACNAGHFDIIAYFYVPWAVYIIYNIKWSVISEFPMYRMKVIL